MTWNLFCDNSSLSCQLFSREGTTQSADFLSLGSRDIHHQGLKVYLSKDLSPTKTSNPAQTWFIHNPFYMYWQRCWRCTHWSNQLIALISIRLGSALVISCYCSTHYMSLYFRLPQTFLEMWPQSIQGHLQPLLRQRECSRWLWKQSESEMKFESVFISG